MEKYKKKRMHFLALATALAVSISGCGEKKESDKNTHQPTKTATTKQAPPKIEIVQNTNKNEIKVKEEVHSASSSQNRDSFYYDYDKKEDAQKERTVLDAYTHIRSPYERVRVSLLQRQLSTTFRLKCSPCHDDYANGVIGPSLLGKDQQYIYDKIIAFKTGEKNNPLMTDLLKGMDDEQIRQIAKEIYTFNQEVQQMRTKIRKDEK